MVRTTGPGDGPLVPAATEPHGSTPLLIGRAPEQAALRAELATVLAGHGRLCLIGGEAGIGKTTLARDLATAASAGGARVLTGSCYDVTNAPPYGPWLDLFEACQRDATLPDAPAAFAGGHLAPITDQAALFTEVRRFLGAVASHQPVVVILEDVHWADPASLDLLRHLAPHLRHWPVLLLVTYRADELVPGRPLTHHLPALVREAEASRLDLRRLDRADLRALIALDHPLAHEDEDRLLAYLDRHAEGNPFFATEILRSLEAEALLQWVDGGWTLGPLDRATVPPLLRQVIEERVIRLGTEVRTALAIAAVIGQEVPLALWAEVAGLADEALLDFLERAVAAHLLEADRDGTRVRFVHALTREALYESILPPRRRAWHLRVAEALLARTPGDSEAIASHLEKAGDPRAVEWLTRAGERAQHAYAWLTAAERFRAAAALLEDVADEKHVHRRLLMRAAYLQRFAYPAESISALDETEQMARRAGDVLTVCEVQVLRGVLQCYSDRFGAGVAGLLKAHAALESLDPTLEESDASIAAWLRDAISVNVAGASTENAAVYAQMRATRVDIRRFVLGWYLAAAGQLDEATTEANRYIAAYGTLPGERKGMRLLTAFAHHGLATAAAAHGQPLAAQRHWERARGEFTTLDHLTMRALTLLDELRDVVLPFETATPERRRHLAANTEADLARASSTLRPGVPPSLAWLRCLVMDGRWSEATALLDDIPAPGNAFLRRETTFARAYLARHRGEPDRAWDVIHPLLPHGATTEPGDIIHQEGLFLLRLAADLCLDAGDLTGAERWLLAHDRWLAWSGSVLGQADGALAWSQYHHAAGQSARARAHLTDALALASRPDQPLVRLATHRLLGEIAVAEKRLAEADAHLSAALVLADSCEVPLERALTLLALAALQASRGEGDSASTSVDEARRIGTMLSADTVLRRVDLLRARLAGTRATPAGHFGLTAREVEVLRLLTRQRTDKEIAETLFISPHTASTHVKHVLAKLGVANRRDAADIAVARGIA